MCIPHCPRCSHCVHSSLPVLLSLCAFLTARVALTEKTGKTGIEQISYVHGNQPHSLSPHMGAMSSLGLSASLSSAPIGGGGEHRSQEGAVVVSIDPERVHVSSPDDVPFKCVKASTPVSGGREGRPIRAFELAQAVEQLGAREILLNCIDFGGQAQGFDLDLVGLLSSAVSIPGRGFDLDLVGLVSSAVSIPVIANSSAGIPEHFSLAFAHTGDLAAPLPSFSLSQARAKDSTWIWWICQGQGFDLDLVELVSSAVSILVIASNGAGIPEHFSQVFARTGASVALAAGIFHHNEVTIESVKTHLAKEGVETRLL
ncbi:unnamed protein product [Closterium sp. Naga37s-1]|nr:unnamed protein product [Closterium sp. Naga37s-1]